MLLGLFILLLAVSSWAESNCYIKLSESVSKSISENRVLIQSYGGRIIHEFSETNEYICEIVSTKKLNISKVILFIKSGLQKQI